MRISLPSRQCGKVSEMVDMVKASADPVYFIETIMDLPLQPWQVRFLSLLKKQENSTSLRASTDHSLVSADLNRIDIRAISATRVASTAISVEGNR